MNITFVFAQPTFQFWFWRMIYRAPMHSSSIDLWPSSRIRSAVRILGVGLDLIRCTTWQNPSVWSASIFSSRTELGSTLTTIISQLEIPQQVTRWTSPGTLEICSTPWHTVTVESSPLMMRISIIFLVEIARNISVEGSGTITVSTRISPPAPCTAHICNGMMVALNWICWTKRKLVWRAEAIWWRDDFTEIQLLSCAKARDVSVNWILFQGWSKAKFDVTSSVGSPVSPSSGFARGLSVGPSFKLRSSSILDLYTCSQMHNN